MNKQQIYKKQKSNYFKDLDAEFRHIDWPNTKVSLNTSLVVLFIVFFTTLMTFCYDIGFASIMRSIESWN